MNPLGIVSLLRMVWSDGWKSVRFHRPAAKASGWADVGRSSPLRGCGDFALLEPKGFCLLLARITKGALQTPSFLATLKITSI
jgi:hypothetical protein